MARDRNKPTQSWMERAKIEIGHEEELTIERAYELGKIRGKKETIDQACEWLEDNCKGYFMCDQVRVFDMTEALRKAMEE